MVTIFSAMSVRYSKILPVPRSVSSVLLSMRKPIVSPTSLRMKSLECSRFMYRCCENEGESNIDDLTPKIEASTSTKVWKNFAKICSDFTLNMCNAHYN